MYHMKKKFTRKVQRSRGIVNKKKNNRKRVTKKVKLSKKNLNKKNKRIKKGGNDESQVPESNVLGGGNLRYYKKQMGGEEPHVEEQMGGEEPHVEEEQIGGSHCDTRNKKGGVHEEHYVGGNKHDKNRGGKKRQKGGNGCGCGVV